MASRIMSMPSSGYKLNGNSYQFPGNNTNTSPTKTSTGNSKAQAQTSSSSSSNSSIESACGNVVKSFSQLRAGTGPSVSGGGGGVKQQLNSSSASSLHTQETTSSRTSRWSVGLVNSNEGKYLTAENFGFKVNCTGSSLRKKQKWTLETLEAEDDPASSGGGGSLVRLISPLGFYLATDKYGKLTCDKSEPAANDESVACTRFVMETSGANGDGRVAFRSAAFGYYLAGQSDRLHCFSKQAEWWTIHLAIHPQINLRHALRKRYARMDDDEIYVDELIPWGSDCLITIEFRDDKYAIRTSNGMYLSKEGKLVHMPSEATLFNIELHNRGCVAFKHVSSGKYLTAVGPQGIVTARSKTVTKDELFAFDPNHAQVSLQSAFNGKLVSVKQGLDVSANQVELGNTETFQLEEEPSNSKWTLRTNNNKYWKLPENQTASIQSTSDVKHPNCYFDIIWAKAGYVVLQAACNHKYVTCTATGHMRATADTITEQELFRISLVNRPILVLKCEYGLVGYKNKTGYKLECNKSTFNVILLEECTAASFDSAEAGEEQPSALELAKDDGYYSLKGSHGLYWDIGSDNTLSVCSVRTTRFSIELLPNNRMLIKGPNGGYLRGEQNGSLSCCASSTDPKQATQWEF